LYDPIIKKQMRLEDTVLISLLILYKSSKAITIPKQGAEKSLSIGGKTTAGN